MIRRVLAAAAAISAIGGLALASQGGAGTNDHGTESFACGDNGEISWGPTTLWPPNHKNRNILITYTDNDTPAKSVMLTVTGNLHNEVITDTDPSTPDEEENGTGNTPFTTDSTPPAPGSGEGSVTVVAQARAERSGHKNDQGGRVYEFDYDATSEDGDGCSSDAAVAGDGILICVPHDMRGGGTCNIEQQAPTQKPTPPAPPSIEGAPAPDTSQVIDQSTTEIQASLEPVTSLLGG